MTATTSETGLDAHGISPHGRVIHNPTTAQLYTHALANGDGRLAQGRGKLLDTGPFTAGQVRRGRGRVARAHLVGCREPPVVRAAFRRLAREGHRASGRPRPA